ARRRRRGGGGRPPRRGVCAYPDEPLAALLTRELAEAQLVPHGMQAGLVYAEDRVQGAIRDPLLVLEQGHHPRQQRVETPLSLWTPWHPCRRCGCVPPPDQTAPLLSEHR